MGLFVNFLVFTNLYAATAEGNKPRFVSISKCPQTAKLLIFDMNINIRKIHYCSVKTEKTLKTKQKVKIVEISYGDPSDCPSGCIYKNYAALVEGDGAKGQFWQVPMKRGAYINPADFPKYKDKSRLKDFQCQVKNLEKITKATYGKKALSWGLFLELENPYICTWVKTVSTKYPVNYKHSFNKGYKMKGEWTGHVFYKSHPMSKQDSDVKTSYPNVKYKETQLEAVKWEEHHK